MDPIDTQIPVDSDALRANIGKTAQHVVIPERYLPLVQAVEGYYGVRMPLVETLNEYFHSFRNVDLLIDGFQTILLRNWNYFERSPDRTQSFTLLSELVLDLLDTPLTTQQTSLLLRQLITWCTSVLSGPHADAYDEPLRTVAETLQRELPLQQFAFLERDTLIHGLMRHAVKRPAIAPIVLGSVPSSAPSRLSPARRPPAPACLGRIRGSGAHPPRAGSRALRGIGSEGHD